MRWHNGRSRRSRNLYPENASKGSVTKKDESAAHSIQARRSLLRQRPDTFAQTNSVILIFRLQNGGGPYIPDGPQFRMAHNSTRAHVTDDLKPYPEWRRVCPAFFASFFRGGQPLAPVQDRAQRALR
jgi:hypothetical protein